MPRTLKAPVRTTQHAAKTDNQLLRMPLPVLQCVMPPGLTWQLRLEADSRGTNAGTAPTATTLAACSTDRDSSTVRSFNLSEIGMC